jgi:hypothetical protein
LTEKCETKKDNYDSSRLSGPDSPNRRRSRYADAFRRIGRRQPLEFVERRPRAKPAKRAGGYSAGALSFVIEQSDQWSGSLFHTELSQRVADRIDQIAVGRFAKQEQQVFSRLSEIQIFDRADYGDQVVTVAFANIAQ